MTVLLQTRGLEVGYGRKAILPPLDLEVRAGELWAVIGRNGAGKTTLLRTLLGLHPAVAGAALRPGGAVLGYVPQRYAVDPLVPARAKELIVEGTERGLSFLSPLPDKTRRARVDAAVLATGSAAFVGRRYRDLSEGQKQRVLLARALAGAPDLLVLDEPTSAMDLVAEREVIRILTDLRDRSSLGILLVSHHLGLLLPVVDRVLLLDSDDGIAVSGTPAEIVRYGAVLTAHETASIPPLKSAPPPRAS
jgi:ABC-type Mn2+/Zn2+ transport system ATPase subunit